MNVNLEWHSAAYSNVIGIAEQALCHLHRHFGVAAEAERAVPSGL